MLWEDEMELCECPSGPRSPRSCDAFHGDQRVVDDKENVRRKGGETEVSLYGGTSPVHRHPATCGGGGDHDEDMSPRFSRQSLFRRPLQDHDPNSLDSGYGTSSFGTSCLDPETLCAMDDEFVDLEGIPGTIRSLISQPIVSPKPTRSLSPRECRPPLRRSLSSQCTPNNSRFCLFKIEEDEPRPFKRPEPPGTPDSPSRIKRCKTFNDDTAISRMPASQESIMCALQRSTNEPDLIGDFSKTFCLPLTPGRHQDLKSITPTTLAGLMKGYYRNCVSSYRIIDCRYPYEFDGGHISGAVNVYTKDQCLELLNKENIPPQDPTKRHILVFHCEFSSARGPALYRYLRSADRAQNEESYPNLTYPEIYLLDGGYKSFYEQFAGLCVPEAYKPMLHPEHEKELRHFRQKSKTWNADSRSSGRGQIRQRQRLGFP